MVTRTEIIKNKKVIVEELKIQNGYDCWGRPEYDIYYYVKNKKGEVIYKSEFDPTKLIEYLTK